MYGSLNIPVNFNPTQGLAVTSTPPTQPLNCGNGVPCVTCAGGWSCQVSSLSDTPSPPNPQIYSPFGPAYSTCSSVTVDPTCSGWQSCATCANGYSCPVSASSPADIYTVLPEVAPTNPGTPTCLGFVLCPTCASGYYCPGNIPSPSASPTCSDAVFCGTCPNGYSCPTSPRPIISSYWYMQPTRCAGWEPCATCADGYSCPTPTTSMFFHPLLFARL